MEGRKVLVFNMMMLVVLVSLLAASAGDSFVGLPHGGREQLLNMQLDCCDNCQCDWRRGYCTCLDWRRWPCSSGCSNCQCDRPRFNFCRCTDWLMTCPRRCMERGSKDDGAGDDSQNEGDASTHA